MNERNFCIKFDSFEAPIKSYGPTKKNVSIEFEIEDDTNGKNYKKKIKYKYNASIDDDKFIISICKNM